MTNAPQKDSYLTARGISRLVTAWVAMKLNKFMPRHFVLARVMRTVAIKCLYKFNGERPDWAASWYFAKHGIK